MELTTLLAQHASLPEAEIERLLSLTPEQLMADAEYMGYLNSLHYEVLEEHLQEARTAIDAGIGEVATAINAQYHLERNIMSSYTLGNWLVGFAQNPSQVPMLVNLHTHLPVELMRGYLPDVMGLLDGMSAGREEWQRALALLSVPLVSRR